MQVAAIVVAAGRGVRAGGGTPKQYQPLGGQSVLTRTLAALAAHPAVAQLVVVTTPADAALWDARVILPAACPVTVVPGGATRGTSVQAGLHAVSGAMTHVLIHDAARPLVGTGVIDRVLGALADHAGAAPAVAISDALWTGQDGRVTGLRDRAGLYRAQTPQGFALAAIRAAHAAHPGNAADDVEVARAHGLDVAIVEGDEDNIKITLPGDFARAERILAQRGEREPDMDVRLGNGYDVHRFGAGDAVMLCGVPVPHSHGLDGHSDADVGMHAITDAIYGALAAGDIGRHFPPSDPQWKGADSAVFLRHAAGLARDGGYAIGNVDCTLVCEIPKIGPHAAAMQARLAEIIGIDAARISVKATTSERLGFTGRGEGIAALATVALVKP
ncbi:bifunctional 2-C-methyl-D-erythritol 4-phosphate cytidylyltransferase/2-C-methyl-D-erythritol 2,4-cyclodiphosphate synthase [Meridianimarinicoccus sp. RP-17]|uniref:bifunctional 2-C-methyl-D-erythritol 4-phosphate cytidylyltransferase/2-C-methyl-D-erythritol 2,4-cyclodiphosphate synthase n=1 Tax=Meridianimarinicoccus zhengii TaxID=2056810 RepID=UPI000DAEFEDC|nr:bifunctional 2-C-methyl-D-erythritol 4-phosphate cytidylyltransferase/2-C-methyl-D-erythritol 2,4-cyclodiphosphate synthase [Phycocomes zhengii]